MIKKFWFVIFFLALGLNPVIGFAQAGLKTAAIPDFRTTSGKPIPNCRVSYATLGELNANKTNAILFPSYFGGKSIDLKGFATAIIDTTKYYVILVDALGNGLSSSPSNTSNFPDITIHDMVVAEHELLTRKLKINHLYAVMGISMGGMQTFEWLASYPDFMDRALPIVGTPKQSAQDALLWETEWKIIDQAGNNPEARKKSLSAVSALHNLNLYSPTWWAREEKPENIAPKMKKNGDGMVHSTNPENWISQIKAMLKQDIYASSGKSPLEFKSLIRAKVLVVVATQDHMVNPQSATEFAKNCQTQYLELTGDCGHMATVCEMDKLATTAKTFLFSEN